LQARQLMIGEPAGCIVLAVEDDVPIRRLLVSALTRAGLTVASARDGTEAIEAMQKETYAVLLLDLMMPRMSGWDVIEWLKAHPTSRPRTVIILSAGKADVIDSLEPAIVNAVVLKPFDLHELTAYVRSCCTADIVEDRRVKRLVGAQRSSPVAADTPQQGSIDADRS